MECDMWRMLRSTRHVDSALSARSLRSETGQRRAGPRSMQSGSTSLTTPCGFRRMAALALRGERSIHHLLRSSRYRVTGHARQLRVRPLERKGRVPLVVEPRRGRERLRAVTTFASPAVLACRELAAMRRLVAGF